MRGATAWPVAEPSPPAPSRARRAAPQVHRGPGERDERHDHAAPEDPRDPAFPGHARRKRAERVAGGPLEQRKGGKERDVLLLVETPLEVIAVECNPPVPAGIEARRQIDDIFTYLKGYVPGFEKWFGVRPVVTPELRARVEEALRAT